MNKFKSIMLSVHSQEKILLRKLYIDRHVYLSSLSSSEQPIEEELIYHYREISFRFNGTGFRTPEKLTLTVSIPSHLLKCSFPILPYATAYEDFLLRTVSGSVNLLSEEYENNRKDSREKPKFAMQSVENIILKRNGCIYSKDTDQFFLRINFSAPLINGMRINGKSGFKGVRAVLDIICNKILEIDNRNLDSHIKLYSHQLEIRKYLNEHSLTSFIKDGSILPRDGSSDSPLISALPFSSPDNMRITIPLSDGTTISGMGIPAGVTVITGGGYSGKSTLLNSIEMGIYNHIPGDGREYVITDNSAQKIYAEDGRIVQSIDISPFFSHMPNNKNIHCFSTDCASGSVSQGVNIVEAVYSKCRLLLIDEDTSAANFMIRDDKMRFLVKNEPIIPFTDRIDALKTEGISTILVIGGSGEYLSHADNIILMDDYKAYDKTDFVKNNMISKENILCTKYNVQLPYYWCQSRYLKSVVQNNDFFYSSCVEIENARYIKIDGYISDISRLTAVSQSSQITSLIYLLEKLFMEMDKEDVDLIERCNIAVSKLFSDYADTILSDSHKYELWLAEIRPIDLFFALSRMRGIEII